MGRDRSGNGETGKKRACPRPDRHRDGFSRPSPLRAHGTKARHIKYVPGFFEKNAMLSDPKRYGGKVDFFATVTVTIVPLRLPIAPLVSCMQLSSILGFIIRMSAWDGGEKVDFFAIASLRTDSQ